MTIRGNGNMTLREYLESYDQPLNEGIKDSLKEKVQKFKENAKIVALAIGVLTGAFGLGNWALGAAVTSSGKMNLKDCMTQLKDAKAGIEFVIKKNTSPELLEKANRQLQAAGDILNDVQEIYDKTNPNLPSTKKYEKVEEAIKKAKTSIKICDQVGQEIWEQSKNDRDAREFRQMRKTNTYYMNSSNRNWIKPAIDQNHYKAKKWRYPYVKK